MSTTTDRREQELDWPWARQAAGRWIERLGALALVLFWVWVLVRWPLGLAAAALAGSVVGVAILLRPALGLPLLAFAVPFGSLRNVNLGPGSVGVQELLLAGIACAWLARQFARGRLSLRWPLVTGAGLLLLGAMLLSLLPAASLGPALKDLLKWGELWLSLVLVLNLAGRFDAELLALGLLGAGAAEGLHGLYQFLTCSGPEGFLILGRFMRAAGTFQQPNPYGGYLGLTLPLALGLALTAWPRQAEGASWRRLAFLWLAAVAAGGLMLGGLIASWSRGAWLGAMVAVAAVVVARGGAWMRGVLAAVVLGAALSLLVLGRLPIPSALAQRFSEYAAELTTLDVRNVEITDANFAVVERTAHWQAALGMFADHPWTGVGIGNYATAYEKYALPRWGDPLGHAHNYYLNVAAETGLAGLAAYMLWTAAGFWLALRAVWVSVGWKQGLALGALGMCVHLSVHNLFDNLYVHGMAIQVGLVLGLAAWVIAESQGEPARAAHGGPEA